MCIIFIRQMSTYSKFVKRTAFNPSPFNAPNTLARLGSGSDHTLAAAGVTSLPVDVTTRSGIAERHIVAESRALTSSAKGMRSAARRQRAPGDMLAPVNQTATMTTDHSVNCVITSSRVSFSEYVEHMTMQGGPKKLNTIKLVIVS